MNLLLFFIILNITVGPISMLDFTTFAFDIIPHTGCEHICIFIFGSFLECFWTEQLTDSSLKQLRDNEINNEKNRCSSFDGKTYRH